MDSATLDLVVLESDPAKSATLTPDMFSRLVAVGMDTRPVIPVVPNATWQAVFSIVTSPERVKAVALAADGLDIMFRRAYGIRSEKVLDLFTAETWMAHRHCVRPEHVGYWLLWGINWMVIDEAQLMEALISSDTKALYEAASREEAVRSLDAIHHE